MTREEYFDLFHKAEVNLVAFKPVFHCDDELRRMVEMAILKEREACAKMVENSWMAFARRSSRLDITPFPELEYVAKAIRAREQE